MRRVGLTSRVLRYRKLKAVHLLRVDESQSGPWPDSALRAETFKSMSSTLQIAGYWGVSQQ